MPEDIVLYEHPSAIAIGAAAGADDVKGVAARTYDIGHAAAQRAMSAGMTRKPERPRASKNMVPLPFRERRTNRTLSEMLSPCVHIKGPRLKTHMQGRNSALKFGRNTEAASERQNARTATCNNAR